MSEPKTELKKVSMKITKDGKDVLHEVDSDLKDWAIVNEVGVGRWLGKVARYDRETRSADLCPAFEMSSPSRAPVLAKHPTHGDIGGVISGFNCAFVLEQDSMHPVEDIYVSSIQRAEKFSDELKAYCFNIIADAMCGPFGTDGKRRRNRQ